MEFLVGFFWLLPHIFDQKLLVVHDLSPADPASDHRGAVMSCTGGGGRVA